MLGDMDYGFDTWIYSILDVEKALERLRDRDVRFVEICFEHLSKLSINGEIDLNALRRIKETADSLGVRIIQVHAPYGEIDFELASIDSHKKDRALRKTLNLIKHVGELELGALVFHTARLESSGNYDSQEAVEKTRLVNIGFFKEASKQASEHGVEIAVENRLENGYGALPKDLSELLKEVNNDCFGICLDVGHANVNKLDPSSFVESLGESLVATHIHDNNGLEDQHLPPLMGNIDWNKLVNAFLKIGYRKPLILEVHEYSRLDLDDNVLRASSILMDRLLKY
ncbi:MAG: sugar phosphate isomerase/epimerase family protein [Thermoproteota archaeon]